MVGEINYWVGGIKRSGTSMMMHCLHTSGMEAAYDRVYSAAIIRKYSRPEYTINPYLYELKPGDRHDPTLRGS